MLSKNTIKFIQSLYQKQNRQQEQVFVVEGSKMVAELLQSHLAIKHIYAVATWVNSFNVNNIPTTTITTDELKKISNLQTPQEVVALVQFPATEVVDVVDDFTLVLDTIQDPGNLGTIIRLADWFGIKQIVCSTDTVDCFNPKVLQASMGSFMRVNCSYQRLSSFLEKQKIPIYGAVLNGNNVYTITAKPGCIVIGNEGKGISPSIQLYIQEPITIPRKGAAESLNAAVATGIILSHLCS